MYIIQHTSSQHTLVLKKRLQCKLGTTRYTNKLQKSHLHHSRMGGTSGMTPSANRPWVLNVFQASCTSGFWYTLGSSASVELVYVGAPSGNHTLSGVPSGCRTVGTAFLFSFPGPGGVWYVTALPLNMVSALLTGSWDAYDVIGGCWTVASLG